MKWLLPICVSIAGFCAGMWSAGSKEPASTPVKPKVEMRAEVAPPTSDPVAVILSVLRKEPGLLQFAELSGSLESLSAAQIGDLIDRLERDSRRQIDYRAGWLFRWWIERDPEAASAWVLPRFKLLASDRTLRSLMGGSESTMIQAWSKAFPDRALEFARLHSRSGLAASLLGQALEKDRANPPGAGWKVLRDFPDGPAKARETVRFLDAWAKKDAAAAFAAAKSLDAGKAQASAIEAVLPSLAAVDLKLAFDEYNRLSAPSSELLTKMIAGAATKYPAAIAEWLLQLGPERIAEAAPGLLDAWVSQDPKAALDWMTQHRVPLNLRGEEKRVIRHTGFSRMTTYTPGGNVPDPFRTAMLKQPEATMAWLQALAPGPERNSMTERFLSGASADHALQLFGELTGVTKERAAFSVAQKLATDPPRATKWALSLPPGTARENAWYSFGQNATAGIEPAAGADRDAWLHGKVFGVGVLNSPPEVALATVMQIENIAKRREVFDAAMTRYAAMPTQTQQALEWMETAKIPSAWREKWQKK